MTVYAACRRLPLPCAIFRLFSAAWREEGKVPAGRIEDQAIMLGEAGKEDVRMQSGRYPGLEFEACSVKLQP
ncbi:hypothetical protein [Prosthecobacter sp.]|uniref:hypothetical protein n=1 Tax=Prosthecobacter sp. TaxID=1965333 RepID=UPI003784DD24